MSVSHLGCVITFTVSASQMRRTGPGWRNSMPCGVLPYLEDYNEGGNKERIRIIAGFSRDWTAQDPAVKENRAKCNRTYTRFTTLQMSAILPDISDAPSGRNTDNHYFYEILKCTGNDFYIQCSISSRNFTDDFRAICDRINEYYPSKRCNENWQWRSI